MPDESIREVYHSLNRVLAIFTGHYQSMVSNPSCRLPNFSINLIRNGF